MTTASGDSGSEAGGQTATTDAQASKSNWLKGLGGFLTGFFEPPPEHDISPIDRWRARTTSATCIVILVILLVSAALFSSGLREFGLIVASGVFGWVLGWLLGLLLSPVRPKEIGEFKRVLGVIGTFLSGWFAAKVDKLMEQAATEKEDVKTIAFCVLAASSTFFMSAVSNFIWRRYVEKEPNATGEPRPKDQPTDQPLSAPSDGDGTQSGSAS
jgi:hypothetical protein